MDIYIKPVKKVQVIEKQIVYLEDVAEIWTSEKLGSLKKLPVFRITEKKRDNYLLSSVDIIRQINLWDQTATINNLGEMDTVIEYYPQQKKTSKFLEYCKVAFVCAILFVGATTTIMCFHSDNQLPLIFQKYAGMFLGNEEEIPMALSVSYSIGLSAGIMIFFNHIGKKSISLDPTPIEVEMTTYEKETGDSLIDRLNQKRNGA